MRDELLKIIADLQEMRKLEANGIMFMANSDDTMFEDCIRRLKEHWAHRAELDATDMWWRDASRERPARDQLVIAWTDKYGALLADRETSNPDFGWSCDGKVLYWMPLPPIPSQLPHNGKGKK